jgi:Xaa-Pro aminopeptidase
VNPIAKELLRIEGMTTRRQLAWIPASGTPVAFMHAIEQGPWRHWSKEWKREIYSSWKSLETLLARYVAEKRVAMEYSPGDAVPYLDRIPAGVLEMVRAAGAEVVSSGELVSRFYAVWSDHDIESHQRAAEVIAAIAREALAFAGRRAHAGHEITEHELMGWILDQFHAHDLSTDHGPNVSVGENAANPHYERPLGTRGRRCLCRPDVDRVGRRAKLRGEAHVVRGTRCARSRDRNRAGGLGARHRAARR